MLELSKLEPPEGVVVAAKLEGVEAEVARSAAVKEHGGGGQLALVGDDLESTEGEEDLPEAASRNAEEGLSGELVVETGEGEVVELLGDDTEGTKHTDTSVLELGLTEPLQVEVVGEAKGVEADIAGHGSVKCGRAGQERHGVGLVLHAHACRSSAKDAVRRTNEEQAQFS
jgi:hypothetical protein